MIPSSCRRRLASSKLLSLHHSAPSRPFSLSSHRNSHIGSAPLAVPADVSLELLNYTAPSSPSTPSAGVTKAAQSTMAKSKSLPAATRSRSEVSPSVKVTGPRGELLLPIPKFLRIDQDDKTRRATVSVEDRTVKAQRAMWGTTRAHLNNFIVGVSEGHTTILRLVGVGYRALIENAAVTKSPAYPGQQFVSLKVGFNHPIELGVPQGVKASVPLPTRILLEGINKEVIKSFAAKIRAWRVPEPYKGKGIFVDDETVILKAKRIK